MYSEPAWWTRCLLTILSARFVGDPSTVPARKYSSIGYFLEYPESIGYVHITSADDVTAPQDFDPKYMDK